jgi:DNA-binding PadR family transcriptional regulator
LSRAELTSFSHVVLILVGRSGAGPHDLVRMQRTGRIYGDFAESQWYAEPKRLAKLGYLTARTEPGQTRPRTHYELTDKGREAIALWVAEPTPFSRIQLEPAWRLLAADLVGDDAVLASLRGLAAEIEQISTQLDEAEANAASVPHRERHLRLNHRLGRRLVDAHREWLAEVERELTTKRKKRR